MIKDEYDLNELIERFELYRDLKDEFSKVYRYKHKKVLWDCVKWCETTDKLYDIIYKKVEGWIEDPVILEEDI